MSTINSLCPKFTEIFVNFDISYKKFCYEKYNGKKKKQIKKLKLTLKKKNSL